MINEIQFDLNQAIQGWRSQLAQSPALQPGNLDELEAHLRDSVATMQTRGLSDEEAFMVAAHRIGKDDLLEKEFAKLNGKSIWLDHILWMLIGIQVWGQVSCLSGLITRPVMEFGWFGMKYGLKNRGMGMVLPITLFTFFQMVMWAASIGLCWWLIVRKGRQLAIWLENRLQRRSIFVIICGTLCVISLLQYGFIFASTILFVKFTPQPAIAEFSNCSTASSIAVGLIQIVAMSAFTLVLLRKRLLVKAA